MNNLAKPKWIFIINTVPLLILFFIMKSDFEIIKSLLTKENIALWKTFCFILGIYGILNFSYALVRQINKKEVHTLYALGTLILSIAIIYFYVSNLNDIIPFDIPAWMIPGERLLYTGTFLMPTIVYSIFVLVVKLTSTQKKFNALISFGITILIPLSIYLFFTLGIPSWLSISSEFGELILIILVIAATVLFLFFLVRALYIVIQKKAHKWKRFQLLWKVPFTILLPLLGLYFSKFFPLFGNFNAPGFYIIASINGIVICLPDLKNRLYRLVLFIGRSLTYSFSFYFFIVFIPFLPFSVLAIIALGAGFLILSPIILFIVHTNVLIKDWKYLIPNFHKKSLWAISIFSFLIIPGSLTVSFYQDKYTLNQALNYLYSPDYSKEYKINDKSLKKTMETVSALRDSQIDFFDFDNNFIPYITSLFNKIVFNNQTISNKKMNDINGVFYNEYAHNNEPETVQNSNIFISDMRVNSRFDKTEEAWISRIDIELTNSTELNLQEYSTVFELPEGCWISDYYLYVNGIKEPGILSEKKSALWIFNQIKNRDRRDPGILYYLTGNRVSFKVFPFLSEEMRKTGIEFIHKNPVTLNIEGQEVQLGDPDHKKRASNIDRKNHSEIIYISAQDKRQLDVVKREPYFHFIVDTSEGQDKNRPEYTQRMESLLDSEFIRSDKSRISFTNTYVGSFDLNNNMDELYDEQSFQGGFYLDRAIRKALFESYNKRDKSYPLIVVVTDNINKSIIVDDFSDFKMTFPDSSLFYSVNRHGELLSHSLLSDPLQVIQKKPEFNNNVLAYPNKNTVLAYVSNNKRAEIVLTNRDIRITEDQITLKNWDRGLILQGMWMQHKLNPEVTGNRWKELIRLSFKSHIMTPTTSFLVVENEAQKAMLFKKQEQVLNGKENLDLEEEEAQEMSEPGVIIVLFFLGLIYLMTRKRYVKGLHRI